MQHSATQQCNQMRFWPLIYERPKVVGLFALQIRLYSQGSRAVVLVASEPSRAEPAEGRRVQFRFRRPLARSARTLNGLRAAQLEHNSKRLLSALRGRVYKIIIL